MGGRLSPMNFAFTEEQEELRKTVRAFLEAKSSESAVREQMETDNGFDAAVWSQMGEQMGLQGLIIPEEFGGSGYSYIELIVVLEEMGRRLLCAPYFSTVALAANTLMHSGDDAAKAAYLPGIASGETIATVLQNIGDADLHRKLRADVVAFSRQFMVPCGGLGEWVRLNFFGEKGHATLAFGVAEIARHTLRGLVRLF